MALIRENGLISLPEKPTNWDRNELRGLTQVGVVCYDPELKQFCQFRGVVHRDGSTLNVWSQAEFFNDAKTSLTSYESVKEWLPVVVDPAKMLGIWDYKMGSWGYYSTKGPGNSNHWNNPTRCRQLNTEPEYMRVLTTRAKECIKMLQEGVNQHHENWRVFQRKVWAMNADEFSRYQTACINIFHVAEPEGRQELFSD